MPTHKHDTPSKCPYCDTLLTASTNGNGATSAPVENDVTVCIGCAHFLVYAAGLVVRKPTEKELSEFNGNVHYRLIQRFILNHIKAQGVPV